MKNIFSSLVVAALLQLASNAYAFEPGIRTASYTTSLKTVQLSVVTPSDAPHTAAEHIYLLKAENTSDKTLSFTITANNINCGAKLAADLQATVYEDAFATNSTNTLNLHSIPAHGSVQFYVKLLKPQDTPLKTSNCMEIKAVQGKNILSDGIIIESYIPDPKDFR